MCKMSDTKLSVMAGVLLVAGCMIGGLIIASGVLANLPGADMLMAISLAMLVPTTIALIGWLYALDKSSAIVDEPRQTKIVDCSALIEVPGRELTP